MWTCEVCNNELGDYNAYCEYCKRADDKIVYNPNKYYIREIVIYHLITGAAKPMTEQEELFKRLFNHEQSLVKDMDTLALRAHIEELSKIAFEARARFTAADDEERERRKEAKSNGKTNGFQRSLNTDETTTNAINAIKERQTKLTKKERVQEGLKKLYELAGSDNPSKLAAETASNAKLAEVINKKTEEIRGPLHSPFIIAEKKEEKKPFINPFAKKD